MQTGVLKAGEGKAFWVVGDLYAILASGEDAGGYALIHLAFHAAGQDVAGTTGTWVTLARGSLHTFRNAGTTTARMLIVVAPSGLERFFAEVGQEATDRLSPPPMTPADVERMLAVAPRYGLEVSPAA